MDAFELHKLRAKITELETRVEQLEASETSLIQELDHQRQLIREVNFRVLFAMRYFQFGKQVKTGVLDEHGAEIVTQEKRTMWDIYNEQHEDFVAKMEAEVAAAQGQGDADATAQAGTSDHQGGSSPSATSIAGDTPNVVAGDFSKQH